MMQRWHDYLLRRATLRSKRCSRANLYRYLQQAIVDHDMAAPAKTLNIGAGGEIAEVLETMGVESISFDVDSARDPQIVGSVENMHMFADESFDGVICMEVLEHVQDPLAAAAEIVRVLKPMGKLIGSTPFMLGIHDAPQDYYRYTSFGISHLFRMLERIEITPRNDTFSAAEVLTLRVFSVGSDADRNKLAWRLPLLCLAHWIQSLCGSGIDDDQATTGYFFVFEKRASG